MTVNYAAIKNLMVAYKILQHDIGYIYLDSALCSELPLDRH